jgi:hypothetical protein
VEVEDRFVFIKELSCGWLLKKQSTEMFSRALQRTESWYPSAIHVWNPTPNAKSIGGRPLGGD